MKKVILLTAYLLLNVVVSASVTLLVMWWWEQTHPDTCAETTVNIPVINPTSTEENPAGGASSLSEEEITATLPSLEEPVVKIDNVFGAGDIQLEVVVLERIGEGDLWLAGWQLVDQDGNQFTFPAISLRKGTLEVYTRSGTSDLKNGLNWGAEEAIWQTGEIVTLLDPLGNVRATYQIP